MPIHHGRIYLVKHSSKLSLFELQIFFKENMKQQQQSTTVVNDNPVGQYNQ